MITKDEVQKMIVPTDGPSAMDIAREIIPGKSDRYLEDIIWSCTGYPSFWNIGKDGDTPEECFRTQLMDAKSILDSGECPLKKAEEEVSRLMNEFKENYPNENG